MSTFEDDLSKTTFLESQEKNLIVSKSAWMSYSVVFLTVRVIPLQFPKSSFVLSDNFPHSQYQFIDKGACWSSQGSGNLYSFAVHLPLISRS